MTITTTNLLLSLKEIYGEKIYKEVAREMILEKVMEGKPPIKSFRCKKGILNVKLKL